MSGSGIFISVWLLMLQSAYLVTGETYRCEITGDPHLTTFGGQVDSLSIPCAFFVTKLRLTNLLNVPGETPFSEIRIEIHAGNSQHSINGRYYVSDIFVAVIFSNGTGVPGINNTYYIGENIINHGKTWIYDMANLMQSRVQLLFNATDKSASLQVSNTTFKVEFRPVNRSQGNHQAITPGIFVEMGSEDFIDDPSMKFPATVCSTVDDDHSIDDVGEQEHFLHRYMGIYAVLEHMAYSIPDGDQSPLCSSMMGKYGMCTSAKSSSFTHCFGLMRFPPLVSCLEELPSLPYQAASATDSCLDYYCSGGPINCDRLQNYTTACPSLMPVLGKLPCPFMQNVTTP